ncbi:MAG: RNA 2',3'-cyclic phosphodiesterase [Chloroflexi bacterium]|nr:RNA 2',3'-cyclic phosphodiesterase [Chloroflexota bacterium]
MEKIRAFIALEMPDPVRRALDEISFQLRKELSGAPLRWVPVGNMHLTLKFLGDISRDQVPAITQILESESTRFAPMKLNINGLGAFPNPQRARVLWAGLNAPDDLHELQNNIEARLTALGFSREERAFSPHLTLARVRGHARPVDLSRIRAELAATPKPSPTSASAERITLFRSELKSSGSVYNALSQFVLSGRD